MHGMPFTAIQPAGKVCVVIVRCCLISNGCWLANPDWVWELVEAFPTEKGFTGKWKATIPVGNKVIIEYGVDIVEVSGGKVTRNEVYFDRTALLEAYKQLG